MRPNTRGKGLWLILSCMGLPVLGASGCGNVGDSSKDAAFIAISGGSQIEVPSDSTTEYNLPFNVLVTSKDGVAIEDAVVDLSVVPKHYYKGYKAQEGGGWTQYYMDGQGGITATFGPKTPDPVPCPNEDANRNAVLDPGEDINGNGELEPGNPVAFASNKTASGGDSEGSGAELTGRVRTESDGFAEFTLNYGKDYALYLSVEITATTSVTGTEGTTTRSAFLYIEQSEMEESSTPPGQLGPFGYAPSCTNPA